MQPGLGDGRQIEAELVLGGQQLEPLGVGLHQGVLDTVVDHLYVVAGAAGAEMTVANVLRGGQGAECRLHLPDRGTGASDHETETVNQAPDPTADAHVDELYAEFRHFLGPPHAVFVVGVATINQNVARGKQGRNGGDGVLGGLADGEHHPDGARRGQEPDQFLEGCGTLGSVLSRCGNGLRIYVVSYDAMATGSKPPSHVSAHAPKADESQFQVVASKIRVDVARSGLECQSWSRSSCSPAGTSPPRSTVTTRRPRLASAR